MGAEDIGQVTQTIAQVFYSLLKISSDKKSCTKRAQNRTEEKDQTWIATLRLLCHVSNYPT